jgi:uncharacterized protein
VAKELARTFSWRQQRLLADLSRHRAFRRAPPQLIAIAGTNGLVGSQLAPFLTSGGHTVLPLVRRGSKRVAGLPWDPDAGVIDSAALADCDAIIHLGGAGIADRRWSPRRKRLIMDSRVRSTRLLAEALAATPRRKPMTLIVASAIGWYGDRGEEIVDEFSAPGSGFLADVCRAWEDACEPARRAGIRVVNLRIGMVLSHRGGALARMLPAFRLGLGGPLGSGEQWLSWIWIDDLVYAIHHALMTPNLTGAVNAVAPFPIRQRDFAKSLAKTLNRPCALRTPAWAIRATLGDMGRELLLSSCRVASRRLEEEIFAFGSPDLATALERELAPPPAPPRAPPQS